MYVSSNGKALSRLKAGLKARRKSYSLTQANGEATQPTLTIPPASISLRKSRAKNSYSLSLTPALKLSRRPNPDSSSRHPSSEIRFLSLTLVGSYTSSRRRKAKNIFSSRWALTPTIQLSPIRRHQMSSVISSRQRVGVTVLKLRPMDSHSKRRDSQM